LAGKDKGKQGEISSVNPFRRQSCCRWREHGRSVTPSNPSLTKAVASQWRCRSNCRTWPCWTAMAKATRVGFREEDGKKVRFAKTTGEVV
jgi:large subunit ribosomal protein L24